MVCKQYFKGVYGAIMAFINNYLSMPQMLLSLLRHLQHQPMVSCGKRTAEGKSKVTQDFRGSTRWGSHIQCGVYVMHVSA